MELLWDAVQAGPFGQGLDDTQTVGALRHLRCKACPAVLVDQRQDARRAPIVSFSLHQDEVPNVVATERAYPHAGAVIQSKRAARSVLSWDGEPLATPDALNPIISQPPTASSSAVIRWRL